jgi:hypothetical protein
MGKITLRFFEFSFLVHSADRLTILFPASEHGLVLKHKGRTFPVKFGANLELRNGKGESLPPGKTTLSEFYKKRVPEVNFVEGKNLSIDPDKIKLEKPPVPTLNAKLHVSGGELDGLPCSLPAYRDKEYMFSANKSKVTDIVEFYLDGAKGATYRLFMNGVAVRTIDDNDVLEFNNADLLGATQKGFFDLSEYVALLKGAMDTDVPEPTPVGAAVSSDGIDNVCANARLELP